ncbi:unnamed protein product [Nesidiocoris tenuis]|uniref:Uncharacterized protein n=1 Tax=Nesidiocoris tenuis TaxID=355587 RepID=A0A6H5GFI0_9HEMI|nr:unnamed protein product [Nesidiocoris tenuis]
MKNSTYPFTRQLVGQGRDLGGRYSTTGKSWMLCYTNSIFRSSISIFVSLPTLYGSSQHPGIVIEVSLHPLTNYEKITGYAYALCT